MNQEVLGFIDTQQIIESRTQSFWQKYVKGINMTFIECEHGLDNCNLTKNPNQFYVYTHYKSVSLRESLYFS